MINGGKKLTLVHTAIKEAPVFELPAGYTVKWYEPGNEDLWVEVQRDAEEFLEIDFSLYKKDFGLNPSNLSQRQMFLYDAEDECIGTGTAWHDQRFLGSEFGRVHWIAIKKKSQGLRLSYPIVSAVMTRLIALGYKQAFLTTSSARIAAIKTYLKFGFKYDADSIESVKAWEEFLLHMGSDEALNFL